MWTILYRALWKPRDPGGYTGTGINPARTQPKKAQIISRPGGYASSSRSSGSELPVAQQVRSDCLCPFEKLGVGVALELIAVQVKVRIQEFVRMLIPQLIELVQNRYHN